MLDAAPEEPDYTLQTATTQGCKELFDPVIIDPVARYELFKDTIEFFLAQPVDTERPRIPEEPEHFACQLLRPTNSHFEDDRQRQPRISFRSETQPGGQLMCQPHVVVRCQLTNQRKLGA